MRVKILTEGGHDIGLGHISRCSALYDEAKRQGYEAELIISGDVGNSQMLGNRKAVSIDWINEKFVYDNINPDDYCIVDSYRASREILERLSEKANKVLYIDDTHRMDYPKGVVINPSLDIGEIKYPDTSETKYYWGPKYVLLRSPFANIERKNVKGTVGRVLISMGGSDIRNLTPTIVKEICSNHPEIEFDIIIGATYINKEEVEALPMNNIRLHSDVDAYTMRGLMMNADFAIVAAGQTIYELMATRTPFIPIQVAENQSNNINSLRKLMLIQAALNYSSSSLVKDLEESYIQLLAHEVRNGLSIKIENIVDGKGCERTIKKLFQDDDKLIRTRDVTFRPVSVSDCDLIYEWASDRSVRKNAFDSGRIDYEEHKKWFECKLESENILFYIVLKNNIPVGQIRIDIENENGIINYSIASGYRGLGLGKATIKLIADRAKKDRDNLRELVGRVKIDNTPSQRAFESAGYRKRKMKDYYEYRTIL